MRISCAMLVIALMALLFVDDGCARRRRRARHQRKKRGIQNGGATSVGYGGFGGGENIDMACLDGGPGCEKPGGGSFDFPGGGATGSNSSMSMNIEQKKAGSASNIAQKAAQEAKAAQDAQAVAGAQASHQVKEQLAEKAAEAARAAEAAWEGKEAMVAQIEQEIRESEAVSQEETASLQQTSATVSYAVQTARESNELVKLLQTALQLAQALSQNAEQSSVGAQAEVTNKNQLLDAAKSRVEALLKQLATAKTDLSQTKANALKAIAAAKEAKQNAARNRRMMKADEQLMEEVKLEGNTTTA